MKYTIKILLIGIALVAVGCAGAPDPEPEPERAPEPVVEDPPVEVDLAAENRATAEELRAIVERFQLGPEAPEAYAAAETAFTAAREADEQAPEQAVALYDEASEGYRRVIAEGSRSRADRVRGEVREERDRARSVRAEVAQRQRYDRAEDDLTRAETLLEEEEYEDAFEAYEDAREGFAAAYAAARDQRERALRSLEDLDSSLEDSAERIQRMQDDMEVEDE